MMRTSGSCLRSRRCAASGFSLLEMLVVLALISIMVALVAPRLAGTVRAIATSGERAETARQLERLPLLARGMPVSEVAATSGYASDSAFSAMFKAAMGHSPSRFAASVRGQ